MARSLRALLLARDRLGALNPFIQPAGLPGRAAGYLMALTNAGTERAAIDILRLRGAESVLEVGFGPGAGIEALLDKPGDGTVVGIDPSPEMLRQARRRIHRQRGHAHLLLGRVERLPLAAASFDAAFAVNNALLWQPLEEGLAEIDRVLRPGGRLVLAIHAWAIPGPLRLFVERLREAHAAAGFNEVRIWRTRHRSGSVLFVRAVKAGG